MTILLTGASGFLGSHVAAQLVAQGRGLRALVRPGSARDHLRSSAIELFEGDMRDEKSLRRACRDVGAIVHCGGRKGYWSKHDHEQRHVNVEGTSRLLRVAQDHQVQRIVHVSSISAIGATRDGTAVDETASWNLRHIGIHYVATKRESEERALAAAWGGMPVVVVNPSSIFGPRIDGRASSSTITRIANGKLRWVPPGGTSVCDVEDVARATIAALDRGRPGERYALGGHNLTWLELYAAIARSCGVRPPTQRMPQPILRALALGSGALDVVGLSRPPWTPEVFRSFGWYTFVDSRKAMRELGYTIRPLEQILARSGSRATSPLHA